MTRRGCSVPRCRAPWLLDPDLLGGLGLLLWTLAFLALSAALGVAQPLPPQERRTVSWYVANPWALEAVTRACRDDPGRLRGTPDCVNADQARIVVECRQGPLRSHELAHEAEEAGGARALEHDDVPVPVPLTAAPRPVVGEATRRVGGEAPSEALPVGAVLNRVLEVLGHGHGVRVAGPPLHRAAIGAADDELIIL